MAKRNEPEYHESKAFWQWLQWQNIFAIHVPNEGKHNVQYRAKQKAIGVTSGASDYHIFTPVPKMPEVRLLAIEMKAPKPHKGRVSDSQKEYGQRVELEASGLFKVCYGANEAINFMQSLGYGKK